MHYTVEKLVEGDAEIVDCYKKAGDAWTHFFSENHDAGVEEWAKWIGAKQIPFFEHQCGGRSVGQEVMAWSAFGSLYSTMIGFEGKEEMAVKLVKAAAKTSCSLEVKSHFRDAALSYGMNDHAELKSILKTL
jgi:hypothetical protein